MLESIKGVQCKDCRGKGYIENKCKPCKGSGKITETWTVLVGEEQEKQKKTFDYPCGDCFGDGFSRQACKNCGGHKNLYKYEILPVPFKTVVTGIPVLHSSGETKYEKQIGDELIKVIDTVEGIKFTDFKDLSNKAEASLGYYNNKIKKTISSAGSDHKKYEKDKDSQIQSQIHLFPMIQMFCQTKKGSKFEIYSIGSGNKFMIFSDF
jgi:RecJ-like exonuclease